MLSVTIVPGIILHIVFRGRLHALNIYFTLLHVLHIDDGNINISCPHY